MHHAHRQNHHAGRIATATVVGLGALTLAIAPVDAGARTVVVHPGESIQDAIDHAAANTTIVVAGGVHAEQLLITTDGIRLIGDHATLVPPATAVTNTCSDLVGPDPDGAPTQVGICVAGPDLVVGPYDGGEHAPIISVGRPVSRVRVEGFDIAGFSGPYVAVVGGRNVRVAGTSLQDSVIYGVLSTASRSTRITNNEISGPSVLGYIGICIDDISSPVVHDNDISGQIIGVCVETTGASISRNRIHDNCLGVFVDPGVGAVITRNHIANNNGCDQLPASYGRGVTLSGTHGSVVKDNVIEGHTGPGGLAALSVIDDEGGTVATGNVVTHNRLAANTLDISSTATGTNRIDHNECTTSTPAQLCD
jgi:hypothetical protein